MIFRIWCEEYGQTEEDGQDISAHDAIEAAERWAEYEDRRSADYTIVSGNPVKVFVKHDISQPQAFFVYGEQVAEYTARVILKGESA